jgi:hypothetical protein
MKHCLYASIAASCFLVTTAAAAEPARTPWKPGMDIVTGQDWLDTCQREGDDVVALAATAACDAYMRGVIQTTYSARLMSYEQNHVPLAEQHGDFYCPPAGTTTRERIAAVTAFMARYPAFKVGPAPMGIVMGLESGFPCTPAE